MTDKRTGARACARIGFAAAIAVLTVSAAAAAPQSVVAPPSPTPSASTADPHALTSEPGTVAILRGLDKVTAETRDFEAPVGETVGFGSLEVTVDYCRKRPPEETPDVLVLLDVRDAPSAVRDTRDNPDGVQRLWFSGWMFASSPALNPLDHPVFDLWPIDCR